MDPRVLNDRYEYRRHIGSGAMGEVWLAYDRLLHREVAVKQIRAGVDTDAEFLGRIVREARLAAQLSHPHAVAVHDLVVSGGVPHIVMEYVPGRSLADVISRSHPLEPARIASVLRAISSALDEAHLLGIVHRDIKPANVLVTDRSVAKLADFGIARRTADPHLTHSAAVIGTPAYMSPEVAQGAPATAASDVWSLGATMFAASEGHPPHGASPTANTLELLRRAMLDPCPRPRRAGPLTDLIVAMLDRDPAARPSVRDVVAGASDPVGRRAQTFDMTRLRPEPPTVVKSPPTGPGALVVVSDTTPVAPAEPRRHRRGPWIAVAGVAAAVVATAVVTALAVTSDRSAPSASAPVAAPNAVSAAKTSVAPASPTPSSSPTDVASSATTTTSSAVSIPSLSGVWSGAVYGDEQGFDVVVDLVDASSMTASVQYPQLGCVGTWQEQRRDTEHVYLLEQITDGPCVLSQITLTRDGDHLEYRGTWSDKVIYADLTR